MTSSVRTVWRRISRQNVARLTAEAVIEQWSDGCYDQTASRLKYIKHLNRHSNNRTDERGKVCPLGVNIMWLM
jgi:hypothetical protein